jgi:hypothetical protein
VTRYFTSHHQRRFRRAFCSRLGVASLGVVLSLLMVGATGPVGNAATIKVTNKSSAVPPGSRQIVVGIAADWNAQHVTLAKFTRKKGGIWKQDGDSWAGRVGKKGLAWGRGLHPHDPILRASWTNQKVISGRRLGCSISGRYLVMRPTSSETRTPSTCRLRITIYWWMIRHPRFTTRMST